MKREFEDMMDLEEICGAGGCQCEIGYVSEVNDDYAEVICRDCGSFLFREDNVNKYERKLDALNSAAQQGV